jgi:hypothetical protein
MTGHGQAYYLFATTTVCVAISFLSDHRILSVESERDRPLRLSAIYGVISFALLGIFNGKDEGIKHLHNLFSLACSFSLIVYGILLLKQHQDKRGLSTHIRDAFMCLMSMATLLETGGKALRKWGYFPDPLVYQDATSAEATTGVHWMCYVIALAQWTQLVTMFTLTNSIRPILDRDDATSETDGERSNKQH